MKSVIVILMLVSRFCVKVSDDLLLMIEALTSKKGMDVNE